MAHKAKSLPVPVGRRFPGTGLAVRTPPRTPDRPYHHGNLRNALIDAAVALVDLHGAEALTLREAARRAGVSQTAPYRHFADRDALVAAVAADGFLMLVEDLGHARAAARSRADCLAALTDAYVRFAQDNRGRFALMFSHTQAASDEGLLNGRAALADVLNDALGAAGGRDAWPAMHGRAALVLAGLMSGDEVNR